MEIFLEDLAEKLTRKGIRARVEKPYSGAPRLKAPLTAVAISKLSQAGHQFAPDGSRKIQMTARFSVATPSSLGGEVCTAEALRLVQVLAGDFSPWSVGECQMERPCYAASSDQFLAVVTAELTAVVRWEEPEDTGIFTDFILEGEIL